MSKIDMAWRIVNAVKMSKSAKACIRSMQSLSSAPGDVYKVRLARQGEGKSAGFRVLVFFRSEERTFYVYGFAKSDKGNIDQKEKREYKALAKKYLNLSDEIIERAVQTGKFVEI